ncbi:MAG: nucleotidyltransferase family protein [Actinomycetota bacterium]|nr:nucleotidyltransferase family protein [Actinomycetota bacterium]
MGSASPDVAYAAYWLWMESAIGEAWTHLAAAGIPAILLKGPVIATWLYVGDVRYSQDIDILVEPVRFVDAQRALAELGYESPLADAASCEIGPNTTTLRRAGGVTIDLHHRLIGAPAEPPERCWEVLNSRTIPYMLVTRVEVRALDIPARAMHLALHVAQNGPRDAKPMEDLRRGLALLSEEDWRAATEVAERMGAVQAFAEGLRLCTAGAEVADALGLPTAPRNLEMELRLTSAPFESLFFARLADTPGLPAKAALICRKVWPTPDYMRLHFMVARRGRFGLLRAHLIRPVSLLRRSGPALRAWARARASLSRTS